MVEDDYNYRYPTYQEINPSYNRYTKQNNRVITSRVPSTSPTRQQVKVRVAGQAQTSSNNNANYRNSSKLNNSNDYLEYRDESVDEYYGEPRRMTAIKDKNRGRRRSESPKKVTISTASKHKRSRSETNKYRSNSRNYDESDDSIESDDSMSYYQPMEDNVHEPEEKYIREPKVLTVQGHHNQKRNKVKGSPSKIQSIPEAFRERNDDTKTTIVKVAKHKKHKSRDDNVDEDDQGPISCESTSQLLENGPIRFRHVCLIGGFGMILGNLIDWNDDQNYYYQVKEKTLMYTIISIYVWIIGLFIMTLEMRPFGQRLSMIHRFILEFIYMLRYTWGRGILYFFSGSLQFILFTTFNMIAGGFMMVLGLTSIIMGRMASQKLKTLVMEIGDKSNLSNKFDWADRDKDGYLNIFEFKLLLKMLGITMKKDELIHLFMAIDVDSDRRITYDELSYWYATARKDLRRDGIVVV